MLRLALLATTALVACGVFPATAQEGGDRLEVVAHLYEPTKVEPSDELIGRLQMPAGFSIQKFAEGLVNPRMLAVSEDGIVYVTRRSVGDVVMLKDLDGDGRADEQTIVAERPDLHGIALDGPVVYLTTVNDVYRADIDEFRRFGELTRIFDDLPDGGQHPNRTLGIGPDGKLYITVGSTCNACSEPNPEAATILRAEPDGSGRTIFASGLRNTIGFDWDASGTLFGMDHGIDWLGDEEQGEELNQLTRYSTYGWPYIFADGQENPQDEPPGKITPEEWREIATEPLALYTAHAAPMQMAFSTGGNFPASFVGDAFVAMRGSWNRDRPAGYEVVRIDFENGQPLGIEPFLTGFVFEAGNGEWNQFARLAGLAFGPDGAMFVSDDSGGVIYRIAYEGQDLAGTPIPAVAGAVTPASAAADLALAIVGGGSEPLAVSSNFTNGGVLPEIHGADGENISPPLAWSGAPAGAQSFAIVVEDPDAAEPKPFVHWLAWNIPTSVTELRAALPGAPRLELPEGVTQGTNSRGSSGYFGPRPPLGETHTYHFQVFALDVPQLDVLPLAKREDLLAATEGHVVARGEITAEFSR